MRLFELTEQRELALKAVVYGCNTNARLKGASFMTGIGSEKTQIISYYEALSVVDKMMDSIVTDKDLVPQGEWVETEKWRFGAQMDECSVCGVPQILGDINSPNYCPNCGARMVSK